MKIVLLCIGKTDEKYLEQGINIFLKRLKHYTSFEIKVVKDVKAIKQRNQLMQAEAEAFKKHLNPDDFVVLLDENGKRNTSEDFATYIEKLQVRSTRRLVFIIGGAFGFSDEMHQLSKDKLSLSDMTFSHQMIRLFVVEQVYRAYTIIRNEKYHNP